MGEARLWYASLESIVMTWPELQNQFRRQYSKLGNTREHLFHACRSFHYDENVEMPDAYVTRIRQVARLLGYGELQVQKYLKILYQISCIGCYFLQITFGRQLRQQRGF